MIKPFFRVLIIIYHHASAHFLRDKRPSPPLLNYLTHIKLRVPQISLASNDLQGTLTPPPFLYKPEISEDKSLCKLRVILPVKQMTDE